jgi:hypothetical protein
LDVVKAENKRKLTKNLKEYFSSKYSLHTKGTPETLETTDQLAPPHTQWRQAQKQISTPIMSSDDKGN